MSKRSKSKTASKSSNNTAANTFGKTASNEESTGVNKGNQNKITHVFLDLDQTLISAEATDELNIDENREKMKKFVFHNMDDYYIVFERPGLQPFLTYLFNNFNVSVWTAASKDYALFVIDKVVIANNANRKLDYVFFSYHCDLSEQLSPQNGTKDLSVLWNTYGLEGYNKDNTVIIDDYVGDVHKVQPENCIIATPIEFTSSESHTDDFLPKLVEILRDEKSNPTSEVVKRCNSTILSK
jgi:TFIIF-interacting CTD phosphatase-like protein